MSLASPSKFFVNSLLLPPSTFTIAMRSGVYARGLRSSLINANVLPFGEIDGERSAPGSEVICLSSLVSILTA